MLDVFTINEWCPKCWWVIWRPVWRRLKIGLKTFTLHIWGNLKPLLTKYLSLMNLIAVQCCRIFFASVSDWLSCPFVLRLLHSFVLVRSFVLCLLFLFAWVSFIPVYLHQSYTYSIIDPFHVCGNAANLENKTNFRFCKTILLLCTPVWLHSHRREKGLFSRSGFLIKWRRAGECESQSRFLLLLLLLWIVLLNC